MGRLMVALAALFILGAVSWMTISDLRIRLATLAILGMFALKTTLHRRDAGGQGER